MAAILEMNHRHARLVECHKPTAFGICLGFTWLLLAGMSTAQEPADHLLSAHRFQLDTKENWRLIDTRPLLAFRQLHFPGSIQMACYEIPVAGADWKKEPLLIVGDGANDLALCRRAAALEAGGFNKVRVLQGGIAALPRSELTGPAIENSQLPTSTAAIASALTTQHQGVALVFSESTSPPDAPALQHVRTLEALLALATIPAADADQSPLFLMVETPQHEHTLAHALDAAPHVLRPIYLVEGGVNAFLAAHHAQATSPGRTTHVEGGNARSFYSGTPVSVGSCCD